MNQNQIYRTIQGAKVAGICQGVANHFGYDVATVRIITLILLLVGGISFWIYIILWLILPVR